ncbi:MAG: YdeI/OmpD-associated family protein [Myxococcota bacterium]
MAKPQRFQSTVVRDDTIPKGYLKHYVPVPKACASALGSGTRLVGTLIWDDDEVSFRRVLSKRPDGGSCIRFGERWLADHWLEPGMKVEVELAIDPAPNEVSIPDELALALEANPAAEARWAALTPGKKRTLSYGVERAKRPDTRHRRAQKVVEELVSGG